MSINKKNIVILVEHKIRELNPNIFLATKLVKKGFRVYIGNWLSVDRILKHFDKGFGILFFPLHPFFYYFKRDLLWFY